MSWIPQKECGEKKKNKKNPVERKIRTHLDLLSIPQLGGKKIQNV